MDSGLAGMNQFMAQVRSLASRHWFPGAWTHSGMRWSSPRIDGRLCSGSDRDRLGEEGVDRRQSAKCARADCRRPGDGQGAPGRRTGTPISWQRLTSRSAIWSRIPRTSSRLCPTGSSTSQSMYRRPE